VDGKQNDKVLPTEKEVERFEMLSTLLDSIYGEMREFSKKKPDEVLNQLKVKMINKVLQQAKEALASQPSIAFLELLDDGSLPSNSDAVLIIGQFRSAMSHFRQKFYYYDYDLDTDRWRTQENP
jgi:hypothetical protein